MATGTPNPRRLFDEVSHLVEILSVVSRKFLNSHFGIDDQPSIVRSTIINKGECNPGNNEIRAATAVDNQKFVEFLDNYVNETSFKTIGSKVRETCLLVHHERDLSELKDTIKKLFYFAEEFYTNHRAVYAKLNVVLGFRGDLQKLPSLKKVTDAAFLTLCTLFMEIYKRIQETSSRDSELSSSATIIKALAYMEFCRCPFPGYGNFLKNLLEAIQGKMTSVGQLISGFPFLEEITGVREGVSNYNWHDDLVYSKCIHFWFRILSHIVSSVTDEDFSGRIANTLILYLGHPSKEINLTAHTLFSEFLKSRFEKQSPISESHRDMFWVLAMERDKAFFQPERSISVQEKLALCYTDVALKYYPKVTPLEGFASVLGSMALFLPAGSPVMLTCLKKLSQKTFELLSSKVQGSGDSTLQDTEGYKLRSIFLHLITVLDIQLLPSLLKEIRFVVLKLRVRGFDQSEGLSELFQVVSSCNDQVRKPKLVLFFQQLAHEDQMLKDESFQKKVQVELENPIEMAQHHPPRTFYEVCKENLSRYLPAKL